MLWKFLAVLLVKTLCPGRTIHLDADDTIYHHCGKKVEAAGWFRDAVRSGTMMVFAHGLHLIVLTLSLRSLQQTGELKKVHKKLGVPRSSLGSLSEAARVFDSDLLIEIIGELAGELKSVAHNSRLSDIDTILTIVDGTLLRALPHFVCRIFDVASFNVLDSSSVF